MDLSGNICGCCCTVFPRAVLSPVDKEEEEELVALVVGPLASRRLLTFLPCRTQLTTFAAFGPWGETLIGGLMGMGSGLMGSYAAAASVDSDNEAGVRILRNRRDEGSWLVLVETPNGIEAPWQVVQRSRPQQVVRLNDL